MANDDDPFDDLGIFICLLIICFISFNILGKQYDEKAYPNLNIIVITGIASVVFSCLGLCFMKCLKFIFQMMFIGLFANAGAR